MQETLTQDYHKCGYRGSCPGYIKDLCFAENLEENDEWCKLHKADRERLNNIF